MTGEWTQVDQRTPGAYGIYGVEYNASWDGDHEDLFAPRPFFYRDDRACIHYPPFVSGFYWAPEVQAALDEGRQLKIVGGWELSSDGGRPFEWVQDVYDQRQIWKRQGIEAQRALKLLLASLYGKMSQRVGWQPGRRIPSCHQLEWAGYVTSGARAMLWRAIMQAYRSGGLIACETDSVITTTPLDLPVSKQLGEWDLETYDDIVYLQTGVYWLLAGKTWQPKFRGCDPDSLHIRQVLRYLDRVDLREKYGPYIGRTTRFVGGKEALNTDLSRWRSWETRRKNINVGMDGKRIHVPELCPQCRDGYIKPSEGMHSLAVSTVFADWSNPHTLPWREMEGGVQWPLENHPTYVR